MQSLAYIKLEMNEGKLVERNVIGVHTDTTEYLDVIEEINRQIV